MADNTVTHDQPKTLGVPEAGRKYFGLGRNASYAAARRGDLPTIQIGRLLRAPVVALERILAEAGKAALMKRPDRPSGAEPRRRLSARVSP